jgi:chemotaxis protein methyltransferase CheR
MIEAVSELHPMASPWGPSAPTPQEFALFQALVHRETGIFLTDAKQPLLAGRLGKRLRQLGQRSFGSYYRLVSRDSEERTLMLERIFTHETHFFREPRQLEFFRKVALPQLEARVAAGRAPRSVRVWSAGCSTGEEPYSLAMVLLDRFPHGSGWNVAVLATDISQQAVERAREGIWDIEKHQEIPEDYRRRFMLRGSGSQSGRMRVAPSLRDVVRFVIVNLNSPTYPVGERFEFIFCRNVLIYFHQKNRAGVIERLMEHLVPTGQLFLGHAESVTGLTDRVRPVGPMVYAPALDPRPSQPPETPLWLATP